MHYIYSRANGNGRAELLMHHAQFSDLRIPDHRTFQRFHPQLRETHSFHAMRYDAGQRRPVFSLSLEEGILNVMADRLDVLSELLFIA
ncbi:hypothetical protein TNCV_3108411 [Trichonephila clavipes]|uniref:Uncharacterized protein n=1 Tax=Trichonephila clavipes TaxID=2585209 RepID=A0A8X6SBA7_TRICX|nr:hypothetical protein TNCV_3108411 [Trichonephila clavipes]